VFAPQSRNSEPLFAGRPEKPEQSESLVLAEEAPLREPPGPREAVQFLA